MLFAMGIVLGLWPWARLEAQDLRYPPTPAQREDIMAGGWLAAKEKLSVLLGDSYHPGMAGRPGSTGTRGYGEWLLLWKWCELLSRTEKEAAVELISRHLYLKSGSDHPVFIQPGYAPGDDLSPAPREAAGQIYENATARRRMLDELLPKNAPEPGEAPVFERLDPHIVSGWVADPQMTDLLFTTLSSDDYAPGVLWTLQEIQKSHPEAFQSHPALALAIAVVYDTRLPEFWPHHQVASGLVPMRDIDPSALFASWVEADKSRTLHTKLNAMRPGHLKFVVDAPLNESEFAWARENTRFPLAGLAKAFSAVRYEKSRIQSQSFVWQAGDYTLANILATGGICVDQAYFAMVVGKARGVPTLYFRGQGADGGHAWFGFLKTGGRWEMDAGRYENQNYASGEALDPQNWRPILDHELKSLAEGFRDQPAYHASKDDLILASLFEGRGDAAKAAKAYESAVSVCPQNPEAWAARGDYLARSGASPDQQKTFHEAALRQFETRRDLRVRHQVALAEIARGRGDSHAAAAIEKQIISQNRHSRSDLSVNAASRQLSTLVNQGNNDAAFAEYRRLLASLKQTGGGNFHYEIVEPFVKSLRAAGDFTRATEAIAMARKALHPSPGSILDQELSRLSGESDRKSRK